jgi:hypothetical protein
MMRFVFGLLFIMMLSACNLNQQAPITPQAPDLPTVRFVEPANNARVLVGTDLTVDLYAEDQVGIERLVFYVDGVEVNTGETDNPTGERQFRVYMNWMAEGLGLHILSAVAYRVDGAKSDEAYLTVEVVAE